MARVRRRLRFRQSQRSGAPAAQETLSSGQGVTCRPDEVEALMKAARRFGRHGERDAAMVLLMFRHGLRTAELVSLKWSQVDLKRGYLDVKHPKGGNDSKHPLRGPQLRALRQLQRDYPKSPYIFVSERGAPLSPRSVRHIIARAGEEAGLGFTVIPINSGMPAATFSHQRGTTPAPFRTTWGIETSTTPSGTRKWPRSGSRAFGRISEFPLARACSGTGERTNIT